MRPYPAPLFYPGDEIKALFFIQDLTNQLQQLTGIVGFADKTFGAGVKRSFGRTIR
jgi:hypothetical protein